MSEDEAFIRAIVDSPGDDTARLVYADWLDERSDPRGSYLHAEFEWAKPWRGGERPAESAELRALAAKLDSVWVARVSRPPAGVCCDFCTYDCVGPQVSRRELDQLAAQIDRPLTSDYRAFLLNINGGVPMAKREEVANPGNPTHCFYSLDFDGRVPNRRSVLFRAREFQARVSTLPPDDFWGAEPGDAPWFADALPVGDSGQDFTLFYATRGKYAGRLHLHDYTGEWCRFGWIAGTHGPPTLPEFLSRLPQGGPSLADTYPSQPLQEFWQL